MSREHPALSLHLGQIQLGLLARSGREIDGHRRASACARALVHVMRLNARIDSDAGNLPRGHGATSPPPSERLGWLGDLATVSLTTTGPPTREKSEAEKMLKNRLTLTIFGRFLEGNLTLTTSDILCRPNMVKVKLGRPDVVKVQISPKNRPNMVE